MRNITQEIIDYLYKETSGKVKIEGKHAEAIRNIVEGQAYGQANMYVRDNQLKDGRRFYRKFEVPVDKLQFAAGNEKNTPDSWQYRWELFDNKGMNIGVIHTYNNNLFE
jgi:hypothetical protein